MSGSLLCICVYRNGTLARCDNPATQEDLLCDHCRTHHPQLPGGLPGSSQPKEYEHDHHR